MYSQLGHSYIESKADNICHTVIKMKQKNVQYLGKKQKEDLMYQTKSKV